MKSCLIGPHTFCLIYTKQTNNVMAENEKKPNNTQNTAYKLQTKYQEVSRQWGSIKVL